MKNVKLDIKEELAKHQARLEEQFFANLFSTFAVKVKTFSGDTARAYRRNDCYIVNTPTSIFKHWVHHKYLGRPEVIEHLNEEVDFQKIHTEALKSLKLFWKETEPDVKGMKYFHFSKLIDLLFKSIARWEELTEERQKWFFNHANVPLDKYSLTILGEFHDGYDLKNPSMNFVGDDPANYEKIQSDIRNMISPFPALLFDLYAWDYRRRTQLESEETFELKSAKDNQ